MKKILCLLTFVSLMLTACTSTNLPGISPDSLTLIAQTAQADETDAVAQAPTSTRPPAVATDTPTPLPTPTDPPTATATAIPPTNTSIPPTNTLVPVPTDTPIPPTNTPAPTDTPIPPTATATPEPVVAIPLVSTNDTNVNLRSGPSTDYDRVGVLATGESLEIIGRNADSSWWQVSTPNGLAWVAASVTSATNVDEAIPVAQTQAQPAEPAAAEPAAPSSSSSASNGSTLEQFAQGQEYLNAENWPAALAEFEAVIQAEPDFAAAYKYLGLVHAFNQDYTLAASNFERYLQLAPNADDRADAEAALQRMRELIASGAENLPPGKGAIIMQNCRGDDINVDIIPSDILLELPRRTEAGCTRSDLIILDPGEYATRASIPGVPSLGEGPFFIVAGDVSEWTWH